MPIEWPFPDGNATFAFTGYKSYDDRMLWIGIYARNYFHFLANKD